MATLAEVVGWLTLGVVAWALLVAPIAVVVGRRLRDRQPPEPPNNAPREDPSCR